jgi:hypothetical protein
MLRFILLLGCLVVFSCGNYGHHAQTNQIQTESFLSFKGDLINLSVVVDEGHAFTPQNNENKFSDLYLYKITPGNHRIKVYRNETLVIDEKFYIGSSETREIKIP